MAAELLLVNPRHRSRSGRTRRGRRRMSALQRKYFGKRRKVTTLASNPRRRRRRHHVKRHRRRALSILSSNPRRRRVRRLHRNPRRRMRGLRILRRNPIMSSNQMWDSVMNAGVGAVGAMGVDWALANLPIPAMFLTPTFLPFTRIALAFLIGWTAGEIGGTKAGDDALFGSLAVTLYQITRPTVAQTFNLAAPIYGMGWGGGGGAYGYGYTMGKYVGLGRRRMHGLGRRRMHGLGYIGPGRTLQGMGKYVGH